MKHWRKMTWTIILWTGLFAFWGVTGIGSNSSNCVGLSGDNLSACQAGTVIGGGIGLTIIFALWFIGFVVLSLVWLMTRPKASA